MTRLSPRTPLGCSFDPMLPVTTTLDSAYHRSGANHVDLPFPGLDYEPNGLAARRLIEREWTRETAQLTLGELSSTPVADARRARVNNGETSRRYVSIARSNSLMWDQGLS